MVLLVIGVIAGVGRWRLGKHGVLALLLTLQILLAWFGGSVPAIGAFHPLNAFVILGADRSRSCGTAGRREKPARLRSRRLPSPTERTVDDAPYSGALSCSPPTRKGVVIPA